MMVEEIRSHLEQRLIPFWSSLRDEEYGGFYGYMDYNLRVDREAKKGAILNSRILWFFSSAAEALGREDLSGEAEHAFLFLKERCLDREFGGVFWSVNYDGTPSDTTKHTYNQAFAIYGLSAYYGMRKDPEALEIAMQLFRLIETRMRDRDGYLEAFDREFRPVDNEKLSENGVTAVRTMNTILHVMEAYTELYRVTRDQEVADRLYEILNIVREHIFNSEKRRQEVFFDRDYQSLIDLTSYGHDIEAAWSEAFDEGDLGMAVMNRLQKAAAYHIEHTGQNTENKEKKTMIAIGSDHGGYGLKQEIMEHLKKRGISYDDLGCYSEASCDYPKYARAVAAQVADGKAEKGILICGTGIGMSITANKVRGIRAAAVSDCFTAEATRQHNDANVLCLGARTLGPGLALKIVDIFLDTPFSDEERHIRRIAQIEAE